MKAYFRCIVDEFAAAAPNEEGVELCFEVCGTTYLYWSGGWSLPVNGSLFRYVSNYAAKRGVRVFLKP